MNDPLAICRTCFWSAHITRTVRWYRPKNHGLSSKIWCSHATHFGWHTVPSCEGKAYKVDTRPDSEERHDSL